MSLLRRVREGDPRALPLQMPEIYERKIGFGPEDQREAHVGRGA